MVFYDAAASRKREHYMIRTVEAKIVAQELHLRYDHMRAVTLIGRSMQKALFAGRSGEVVYWALVHAHYRGGDLSDTTEEELSLFVPFITRDPSEIN